MGNLLKFPFYAKAALLLVGLYVIISILFQAQDIILPLIYAAIIAISVSPVVNFLVRKKWNRTLAISIVLIFTLILLAGLIVLLSLKIGRLSETWPDLADKFKAMFRQKVVLFSEFFNTSISKIDQWITNAKAQMFSNSSAAIGVTITTFRGCFFLSPSLQF